MTQSIPLKHRVSASSSVELPASDKDILWRRAHHGDIPEMVKLANACHTADSPWEVTEADDFKFMFDDPDVDLTQDSAIAFDPQGRAIAYGLVVMSREHETLVWVSLDGVVHPERRGRGIGSALLLWQEQRGLQMLSALDTCLPALLAADFWEGSDPGAHFLKAHGYASKRWWLELERQLHTPLPILTLPRKYRIEGYQGTEEASRLVHNLAFRDHWGSQPVNEQEWTRNDVQSSTRTDLSFVVKGPGSNDTDEVLAYVICAVSQAEWKARGRSFGYIEVIGVHPRVRGLGIASSLLVHAMKALRSEGLDSVVLHADAESYTGAVKIYERLGFKTVRRSVTLAKDF